MLFRMKQRISGCFLLEGSADGICAGGSVAGADVDLFSGASVGAVVIYAVGYVARNAFIASAGLAGLFIGLHNKNSFRFKKLAVGFPPHFYCLLTHHVLFKKTKKSFAAYAHEYFYIYKRR